MVTYSPTDEWLNPRLWEFWAMLLTAVVLIAVGYWAALKEDQSRRIRSQRKRARQIPQSKRVSRQRSISYSVETWKRSGNQQQNRRSQSQENTG